MVGASQGRWAADRTRTFDPGAQTALSAPPLELKLAVDNPFRGFDFFETADGWWLVRG